MHAKSGRIERLERERMGSMVQTAEDPYDKTAWFVGVSFPCSQRQDSPAVGTVEVTLPGARVDDHRRVYRLLAEPA